jgi:6,7-dimethyl-8-ribityllumazine synthase
MSDGRRVLIVEARFYEDISDQLVEGATAVLDEWGVESSRLWVPGVFEIPASIRLAVRSMEVDRKSERYDGFIALGCVIRGETDHYDHICREASNALMRLALDHCLAFGFGVLTCGTYEQARVRAAVNEKNKGAEAALACLRMMELRQAFHLAPK